VPFARAVGPYERAPFIPEYKRDHGDLYVWQQFKIGLTLGHGICKVEVCANCHPFLYGQAERSSTPPGAWTIPARSTGTAGSRESSRAGRDAGSDKLGFPRWGPFPLQAGRNCLSQRSIVAISPPGSPSCLQEMLEALPSPRLRTPRQSRKCSQTCRHRRLRRRSRAGGLCHESRDGEHHSSLSSAKSDQANAQKIHEEVIKFYRQFRISTCKITCRASARAWRCRPRLPTGTSSLRAR